MSSDLPKSLIKLAVALLKHQIENKLGKDVISIAGKTLVDVGSENIQAQIDSILNTNDGSRQLIRVALRADEYFREKCEDQDLRDAFTLRFGDQPSIQAMLTELPKALDQKKAFEIIRNNLLRDFPNLTKEQVDNGARIYVDCLNRALLPLQNFTLLIIGNAVLESKEDIKEIKARLQDLLDQLSRPAEHEAFQPETFSDPNFLAEVNVLPPGSHVPFLRNAIFTGREEDLKTIAKALLTGDKTMLVTQPAAVTGMGGIGKTQLAVEFCYRYGRYFYGVHWINAKQNIAAEIAACGLEMGIPNFPNDTAEQVSQTLYTWRQQPWRLVVFDNVDASKMLREWLPKLGSLRILITSHRSQWSPDLGIIVHPLDTLSRAESITLLYNLIRHVEKVSDTELDKIANRLGDLPLALDLAGRYLNSRPTTTPTEYLKRLNESGSALKHTSLLNYATDDNPTAHETSLAATFLLSWNELSRSTIDRLAKIFFRAGGYLAPNVPIPRDVFLYLAVLQAEWDITKDEQDDYDLSKIELSKYSDNVDDAISHLQDRGLLTETLTLHPLLSEFARAQRSHAQILKSLARSMAALSIRAGETNLPAAFASLRQHMEVFAPVAENNKLDDAAALWNNYGFYLKKIANYNSARLAFERALRIDEARLGSTHPNLAIRINNLGQVLQEQGYLSAAFDAYERALKITEVALGPNHPAMAIHMNNLGSVLHDLGDLSGARAAYERALKIDEAAFGPDHTNVAMRLNNLGNLKGKLGDLNGGRADLERALKIDEAALGPDHPNVAIRLSNLCRVLHDLGDLSDAHAAIERAIKIDEAAFGFDGHPYLGIRFNNLGIILRAKGDLNNARLAFERALMIFERFLKSDHRRIKMVQENLDALK